MPDISAKVKAAISEQLEIDGEKVTDQSVISDELGADSLDVIAFLSVLEDEFGVRIPDRDYDKITTVHDLVVYIESKTVGKQEER